jgi:PII-like signaling protein
VVTVVVDRPERIDRAFAVLDAKTRERGLVTFERVPALADAGDKVALGR